MHVVRHSLAAHNYCTFTCISSRKNMFLFTMTPGLLTGFFHTYNLTLQYIRRVYIWPQRTTLDAVCYSPRILALTQRKKSSQDLARLSAGKSSLRISRLTCPTIKTLPPLNFIPGRIQELLPLLLGKFSLFIQFFFSSLLLSRFSSNCSATAVLEWNDHRSHEWFGRQKQICLCA